MHHTPLRQADLPRLLWRDVALRRDSVTIALPARPKYGRQPARDSVVTVAACRGRLCVVAALRRLREQGASPHDQVFPATKGSTTGQPNQRVAAAVRQLNSADVDVAALVQRLGESPEQIRDRAILLLAYGAGLGAQETTHLRQRDVTIHPEGLMLNVPGRQGPTGIPANPGMDDDPVEAWGSWTTILANKA